MLAAESRIFAGASLFGARCDVAWPLLSWLDGAADAAMLWGRAQDPLGDVAGTVGVLGASLLAAGSLGRAVWTVGPRVEVGLGWFRGHAASPLVRSSSATTPLAFFAMSLGASFPVRGPLFGFAGLDAGTSLYGFSSQADDRHVADVDGPFLGAHVGFGWRP
jgi:hypothetical protein